MRKTYFIDIDGTLLEHVNDFTCIPHVRTLTPLPDARSKTMKWHCDGHMIILTTARPESLRAQTEIQLHNAGIVYDLLIMGIGQGLRILINDYVEGNEPKAIAYSVVRNIEGLANIP